MRHGDVEYFDQDHRPVRPDRVSLTLTGEHQARFAGQLLAAVPIDRAITSDVVRTQATARIVLSCFAQEPALETWPDLREIRGARFRDIPHEELEEAFLATERGLVAETTRYVRGETIASLFDRVLPALDRLLGDPLWSTALLVLHSGVNRAIISYALTGTRMFLGNLEQAPGCINVLDVDPGWVVRAVNLTPDNLLQDGARTRYMETVLARYRGRSV